MIPVTNLRAGTIFEDNNCLFRVLKYEHQKVGRGKATIKVKCRDLKSGNVRELNFNSGSKVEEVEAYKEPMEFVYADEGRGRAILADSESKKRTEVDLETVDEEQLKFLKSGQEVSVLRLEDSGEILGVEIPITVKLKVSETTAAEKGDTAGSARKPATLETGTVIQVPMFIKVGDVVKVNTESGEYVERV